MAETWDTADVKTVVSPFNMEMILRACPALYEKWKERPFIFDIHQQTGAVVVRYIEVD